jgi:DNA (cytosine-5)-methyltransferase 1
LLKAGFAVRAAVEIDPIAARSYRRNVGLTPLVMDITKVDGKALLWAAGLRHGECVLMTACPPCQGFSSQRRPAEGMDDPRNRLVLDVARLTADVRPAYLLLENVPGLFNGRGRTVYEEFLAFIVGKLCYEPCEDLLDAADFGVSQHRQRLMALFRRPGAPAVGLPRPTHGDQPLRRHTTVRDSISHLSALRAGQSDPTDPFHAASAHTEQTLKRIMAIPVGGGRTDLPPDLALTCHKGHTGHYDVYGRMRWDKPAPTLTGGCNKPSKGRFVHPEQHRAVTLREAALLQGFPARAWFAGGRDHVAEQIGNAVPPLLLSAIARPIAHVWRREKLEHRARRLSLGQRRGVAAESVSSFIDSKGTSPTDAMLDQCLVSQAGQRVD